MTGTFGYPGSKTTLASWIIRHFPAHTQYVEPFGGAGSVLVAKERSDIEVYNDINGDCVNFFRAVRDAPAQLKHKVSYTPYSRELFDEYVKTYPNWPDDVVERALRFLYVQCASFAGKGILTNNPHYGKITPNSYRGNDGDVYAHKWDKKSSHIDDLATRFKGVNIEKSDYQQIAEQYDHEDSFFYFDPPYVDVGNDYYEVEDGGFDHERFVETVLSLDSKWLISYDHNIPAELEGFHSVQKIKKSTMSGDNPEKIETLTMNYNPNTTKMFSRSGQQGLEAYD